MSPYLVMLVYAAAVGLAIFLLYRFESVAWYWHALSIGFAFLFGYLPGPERLTGPVTDLFTGFAVIFLLFWGAGGLLLMMAPHRHKHA